MMHISYSKMKDCSGVEQLMGYEGTAAKYYFQGLAKLVEPEFYFRGRNRRPPKDEFNSLLSLGYSIVMNEIYGKIQAKGLNPYFGFIHQDREKHPTLASDLMEEWRAVIVDSVVMSLLNGHEMDKTHFRREDEEPGVFLTNDGMKIFLNKMNSKLNTYCRYLDYIEYEVSFRRAMELQVGQLAKATEQGDAGLYVPMRIR
jgi:CRISPR-associated protein Cas1